uniref:Uncharacterized protein n=1 Tax=Anguilla anguilla TaxID=7936 RepID=A0A0E9TT54_ANGAN
METRGTLTNWSQRRLSLSNRRIILAKLFCC